MSYVLIADSAGNPKDWVDAQTAACYYSRNKVIWEVGSTIKEFFGGISSLTGEQSHLSISSILGVTGPLLGEKFYSRESIYADRAIVYARDRFMCAYCGNVHDVRKLTIDHVLPKSKGGKNTWVNCVTSCAGCNQYKNDRTPEQAGLQLLYVPYAPSVFEKMILKNRKILGDQMDYLMARVPKNSRLHLH